MGTRAAELLQAFEDLPTDEKREVAAQIVRWSAGPQPMPKSQSAVIPSVADQVEEEAIRSGRGISELGRQLLDARRKIEQAGGPFMTAEEFEREREERHRDWESDLGDSNIS